MTAATCNVLAAMDDGAVLTTGEHGRIFLSDGPVDGALVVDCLGKGWIFPTRRPVVSGSSLTGRYLITAMGRRFLRIMRAA